MKRRLAILLAALLLFTGCTAKPEDYETEFFAMDTVMTVHLYGAKQAQSLGQALIQQINTLDAALSVTRRRIWDATRDGSVPSRSVLLMKKKRGIFCA